MARTVIGISPKPEYENNWDLSFRLGQFGLKIESADARQADVKNEAGGGGIAQLPLLQEIGGRAECLDAQADGLQQAHKGLAQGGVVIDDENNRIRCGIPLHDPSRRSIDRLTNPPLEAASDHRVPPPHVSTTFSQEKSRLTSGMIAPPTWWPRAPTLSSVWPFREALPGLPFRPACFSKLTYRTGTLLILGVNQRAMEPDKARPYCPEQQG